LHLSRGLGTLLIIAGNGLGRVFDVSVGGIPALRWGMVGNVIGKLDGGVL
jgi:hypothetical protein